MQNGDDQSKDSLEKGRHFKGGSKKKRDRWYGYDDRDFQRWWHRQGKQEYGGRDLENAEEAKQAYEDWVSRGKPIPK